MSSDRIAGEVLAFRSGALSLQRIFSALAPIIRRTSLLSANAEITSAHLGTAGESFGIIARELVYIVQEVAKLTEELDRLFQQVARSSAGWLRAEQRVRSLRLTRERLERGNGAGASLAVHPDAMAPKSPPGPGRAAPKREENRSENRLGAVLEQSRTQVLRDLGTVVALMRRTNRFVNRLSWVAVRQCHFVAVTARIEAASANGAGKDISAVAEEIRHLADDIAAAEQRARNGVLAVVGHIGGLERVYGNVTYLGASGAIGAAQ